MIDIKCRLLEAGQEVNVPNPNSTDIHHHAFIGTVVDVLEDRGTVIVEDQCSDFYEIEGDRLEIRD